MAFEDFFKDLSNRALNIVEAKFKPAPPQPPVTTTPAQDRLIFIGGDKTSPSINSGKDQPAIAGDARSFFGNNATMLVVGGVGLLALLLFMRGRR